jgi:SAM-dependent methyltransferase
MHTYFPTEGSSDLTGFFKRCVQWAADQGDVRKRWHLTRFKMYSDLEMRFAGFHVRPKVLAISGSAAFAGICGLGQGEIHEVNYPHANMLRLDVPEASFDAVVSDQVLEHVDGDPQVVFAETCRVLRPGGIFIHTTCFFNLYHPSPGDYWRFSERALIGLTERAGLRCLLSGSWGSFLAYQIMNDGFRFLPVPEDPSNPLYQLATQSDGKFPISTWIAGAKPLPQA